MEVRLLWHGLRYFPPSRLKKAQEWGAPPVVRMWRLGRTVGIRAHPLIATVAMNGAQLVRGWGPRCCWAPRSGWFIECDERGKKGVEVCEQAHIHLAKRGPKLVRLS